jgi:diguanylate cyclase (GGDEF)-like protein
MSSQVREPREYLENQVKEQILSLRRANASLRSEIADRERAEQSEREQRLLAEALRNTSAILTSTLNLKDLLDRILANLEMVVPHKAASILFLDGDRLSIANSRGYSSLSQDVPSNLFGKLKDLPNIQEMADSGQPIVISDVEGYPYWKRVDGLEWIRSYVGAPIRVQEKTVGFISADSDIPDFFNEIHKERLQAFADQAAIAIHNARLFEETQRRAERLELINQVSTKINYSIDLTDVLQALLDGLAKILQINQLFLALFDESRRSLVVVIDHPAPGSASLVGEEIYSQDNLAVDRILETKSSLAVLDAGNDPLLKFQRSILEQRQVQSILLVPLVLRGEVIGSISCEVVGKPYAFNQEEIHLAETIANLAAIRLEQARLFDSESLARQEAEMHAVEAVQRAKQMAMLNEISQVSIGAPSLAEALPALLDRLVELLDGDQACMLVWDDPSQSLLHNCSVGVLAPTAHRFVERMAVEVLEQGKVLTVEKMPSLVDPRPDVQVQSMMVLPFIADGHKLGATLIGYHEPRRFSQREVALGEQVAVQIALGISKVYFLEAERQRTQQLSRANSFIMALGHVAARIESARDLEQIMETLGSELRELGIDCLIAVRSANPRTAREEILGQRRDPSAGEPASDLESEIRIRYLSVGKGLQAMIERALGTSVTGTPICPERYPAYADAIKMRRAVFSENRTRAIEAIFPSFSQRKARKLTKVISSVYGRREVFLPLVADEELVGALWMWGGDLQESDLPQASIFASQVAIALEKVQLYVQIQRLAITDELTHLYNRRGLFELGQREVERSRRLNRPLACLMIDIDHFKVVNDNYGHAVGDQVLCSLSKCLHDNVREIDIVGRFGGEEFVVLLAEMEVKTAVQVAERLRRIVAGSSLLKGQDEIRVTISVGVSLLQPYDGGLYDLINRADIALYQSKKSGRNCVACR